MRLFRFVGWYYFKYFLIVLLALELFFVGIDSLKYADKMPDSANMIILFFTYDILFALNYTLPISLLLAMVLFYITFIKSNQYTALLSIGFSKRQILSPIFLISLFFTAVYVGLNATPFVYMEEKTQNLIYKDNSLSVSEHLLVKYNDDYVYFDKINPLLQKAQNIKVFRLKDKTLESYAEAKEAFFEDKYWILHDTTIYEMPLSFELGANALNTTRLKTFKTLKNFRPKVLDTIYQNKPAVSITDALLSLHALVRQNADTKKVRSFLYVFAILPFFVPFLSVLIAYFSPSLARYENLALLGLKFIIITLVVWGLFFALGKFSISGILIPEIGVLSPFFIFLALSLWYFKKLNKRL
ncbi:LptF/LptG family permease [Helicobacter pylori]